MNANTLTDTELNRAMIWLYPPEFEIDDDGKNIEAMYQIIEIDYLSDWNLTIPLAKQHQIRVDLYTNKASEAFNLDSTIRGLNDNPLRAICQVLVQIGLERRR